MAQKTLLTAMMVLAATAALAETAPTTVQDPLMKQIMSRQLTQQNGGVTGVVRIGSGEAISLSIVDPLTPVSAPADLKDAVKDETVLRGLKVADGLTVKPAKQRRRKARNAGEQLHKLGDEGRKADWSGAK